jgi:hypothetical protein
MRPKTIVLMITVAVMFIAGPAQAQVRDETILTYEVLTEEWHDLIAGVLDLTEAETEAFWPMYQEYAAVKGALWDERIDVIKLFLSGYDTMGPEVARGLLGASFEIDAKMVALERAYADRFDDVLPPAKVVRLFQAENKLETMMSMEIAKDIPLAKK